MAKAKTNQTDTYDDGELLMDVQSEEMFFLITQSGYTISKFHNYMVKNGLTERDYQFTYKYC
jgi:hypothetical protein